MGKNMVRNAISDLDVVGIARGRYTDGNAVVTPRRLDYDRCDLVVVVTTEGDRIPLTEFEECYSAMATRETKRPQSRRCLTSKRRTGPRYIVCPLCGFDPCWCDDDEHYSKRHGSRVVRE